MENSLLQLGEEMGTSRRSRTLSSPKKKKGQMTMTDDDKDDNDNEALTTNSNEAWKETIIKTFCQLL